MRVPSADPPDPQHHDVLEPLTKAVGHLLDSVGRVRGVWQVEKADLARLSGSLDSRVDLPEPVAEVALQTARVHATVAEMEVQHVVVVKRQSAHGLGREWSGSYALEGASRTVTVRPSYAGSMPSGNHSTSSRWATRCVRWVR